MLDDGAHGDGRAGDGVFGARIPPQPDGAIIEFYVEATDAEGLRHVEIKFIGKPEIRDFIYRKSHAA